MPYFENVTDHRRKVRALYGKEEIGETMRQAMRVVLHLININLLKTSLENGGSLANVALSSIKLIMSANSDLLECVHLMFMICLFHFYSVFPCYFDNTKHIISGVSRTFQFYPNVAFSHFGRKL